MFLTVCLCLCLCLSVSHWSIGGLPVCLRLSICIYVRLHLRSVYLRLFVSIYPFASICLLIAFVYLSASIIYLSICMRLSIASICVCLPLPLCLSCPVCLSVGHLPIGRSAITRYVCLWPVCGLSVCGQSVYVRVCDYAAKPFCAAYHFLGATPSKSPVKQHSDTNHSANVGQGSEGTFRSSTEVSRSVTALAVYSRSGIASHLYYLYYLHYLSYFSNPVLFVLFVLGWAKSMSWP